MKKTTATTTLNIRNIDVEAAQRLKAGAARMGMTLPEFLGALAHGSRWDEQKARLYFPPGTASGRRTYWAATDRTLDTAYGPVAVVMNSKGQACVTDRGAAKILASKTLALRHQSTR